MKMLAKLAVAAGVAAAIPTPGLVLAQVPARITLDEFTVETIPPDRPAPAKPEVKAEATEVVPAPKAEAPKVVPARKAETTKAVVARKAEAPKPAVTPEVAKFLRDWLPMLAPPGEARKAMALMVAPNVPANAFPAPPQAQVEAMTRQYVEHFRPLLRAELRLLTSAAGPSPEQRRTIAIEAGRATKAAAGKAAAFIVEINQNGRVQGSQPDAPKMIRDGMVGAARAHLSPDQVARYQSELDARTRDMRQAVVLNLVANLDKPLHLTPAQRETLVESLLSHWEDRTYPTLENLANYTEYFPILPDAAVTPCLDERQRQAWQGIQKVSFGQSFTFHNGIGQVEAEEDEDVKAALAEEAKP